MKKYLSTILFSLVMMFIPSVSHAATYYISYSAGSDSNNGTSTSTPWQSQPYMHLFSGSYTHHAGDQFIFEGGVTWPSAEFGLDPTAGGSAGNNDYYGVNKTWYVGGSWTQPIFDAGYATSSASSVFYLANQQYITIDNLELRNIDPSSNFGSGIISGTCPQNLLMENLYIHGWRTQAATDDAHGGVIFNYGACGLSAWSNVEITNSTITNADNSGTSTQNGVATRDVQTIDNSVIHDVSSAILFTGIFYNNTMYNIAYPNSNTGFDPTYHENGIYLDASGTTTSSVYDNYFHDISGGANTIYPNPHGGQVMNIYNNLIYGVISAQQPIEIDTYNYGNAGGGAGNVYVYNNTIVNYNASSPAIHIVTIGTDRPALNILVATNNHVMGFNASLTDAVQGSNVNSLSTSTNLIESTSTAASQGYTLGNLYAPTLPSNPTVLAGTNLTSNCSSLTSLCQDIITNPRPSVTAWDIGAYQFINSVSVNVNVVLQGLFKLVGNFTLQ